MQTISSTTLHADVAVIGAGSAGLPAFRAAQEHTDRLVLIEKGPYGTTCARVGCMPSKLLIAAAEAAHGIGIAPRFGVHSGDVHIDGEAVMDRVRRERDRFVGFVMESVNAIEERFQLKGRARFLQDGVLMVDETRVNAARVVIATGSTPVVPEFLHELGDRLAVNDDVFEWTSLPESVAVFGSGVIGLEIGQALHRLGVRVRIFGRSLRAGPVTDPGIIETAELIFRHEFPFTSPVKVLSVERIEDRVLVRYETSSGGRIVEEHFERVMAATGRSPNVGNLGLENTSLECDVRGIPVFNANTMQCGNSPVFIAGDVNHQLPVLHEAADEGRIAGDNAGRYPEVKEGSRSSPLTIVFCDPQIAVLGQSWKELQIQEFVTGKVSFANQGRSRIMLKNRGQLHVYAERGSGRLLGAEAIGPHVEHLAHLLAWSHQQRMNIREMLSMPFYHPVIEEGLRTALRDARDQLGH